MLFIWVVTLCELVGKYQEFEGTCCPHFQGSRKRQCASARRWYLPTSPHGITTGKAIIDIFAAVRNSNLVLSRCDDNKANSEYTHSIIIPASSPGFENVSFVNRTGVLLLEAAPCYTDNCAWCEMKMKPATDTSYVCQGCSDVIRFSHTVCIVLCFFLKEQIFLFMHCEHIFAFTRFVVTASPYGARSTPV